jgi:hypothetical protein
MSELEYVSEYCIRIVSGLRSSLTNLELVGDIATVGASFKHILRAEFP